MSEHDERVVRLDAARGEIDDIAERVTGSPLERGVIVANPCRDAWQPGAWRAGPGQPSAAGDRAGTANNGDWPAPWPALVGGPAVTFPNWPPLPEALLTELRAVMGGRTLVVRAQF